MAVYETMATILENLDSELAEHDRDLRKIFGGIGDAIDCYSKDLSGYEERP